MATTERFVRQIFALPHYSEQPGLEYFRRLCAPLLDSARGRGLDTLAITGSNGKGTTAHLAAATFRALGLSTGLYTSPHLRDFAERMQIGDRVATDNELCQAWAWLEQRIQAFDETPLAFYAMTALGLRVFEEARVEALVAEVGVGGRHDPVRTLPGHQAVLTSLDLEHTKMLGRSLEAIAKEKADLADPGGELLVGSVGADLLEVLRQHCENRRITLFALEDLARWTPPRLEAGKMVFDLEIGGHGLPSLKIDRLEMAILGRHQVGNAVLATVAVARWLARHPEIGRFGETPGTELWSRFARAVRAALAGTVLSGRFEQIADDPEIWVDVAHTPAACRALVDTARWRFEGRPVLLVLGVSENKDATGIIGALAPLADRIICTRAHHRGGDVELLSASLEAAGHPPRVIEPLDKAIRAAREDARRDGAVVLVAGGLFLAIEAAEIVAGRDPEALQFY